MPRPSFGAPRRMSIYSSRRKSRRASRAQLGHLKLSIYEESSALVVHIFEVRGLARNEGASLDTYVKLYLTPDRQKQTKKKTKIVRERDPVFNEKLTYLLSQQDQEKKLFISVWSHTSTSRNTMIGCMSFALTDILGPHRGLNGWYQLLDEGKGKSDNVKVPTSIVKYEQAGNNFQKPGAQTFAVTLMKVAEGYGFRVSGQPGVHPVTINHVDTDLPASQADILAGDVIVQVEGTDVTRADGKFVLDMIDKCPETLHMILQRSTELPPPRSKARSVSIAFPPSTLGSQPPHLSRSFASIPTEPSSNHYPPHGQFLVPEFHGHNLPPAQQQRPSRRVTSPNITPFSAALSQPVFSHQHQEHAPGLLVAPPHNPSSSVSSQQHQRGSIPEGERLSFGAAVRVRNHRTGMAASNGEVRLRHFSSLSQKSIEEETSMEISPFQAPAVGNRQIMSQPEAQESPSYDVLGFSTAAAAAVGPRHYNSMRQGYHHSRTQTEPHDLGYYSLTRQGSLANHRTRPQSNIINPRETDTRPPFSSSMSPFGASQPALTSKPPLPPTSLQPGARTRGQSHHSQVEEPSRTSIPENVPLEWEKLGSLGQNRQRAMHSLMTVECAYCDELQTGIETYIEPLRKIVSESSHRKMFHGLVELCGVSRSIITQLKSRRVVYTDSSTVPYYLEAVADLYGRNLDKLVVCMTGYLQNAHDARQEISLCFTEDAFTQLVQRSVVGGKKPSIYSFVEAGKDYLSKLTKYMMALLYFTPLYHDDHNHLGRIVDALVKICPDRELVAKWETDMDTMRSLQLCIGFAAKVKPFPICIPGRLLLNEGEMFVIERRRKKKMWLMLFSDILLFSRRHGKIFTTMEEQVLLENLLVQDVNCTEPTEFQVQTVKGAPFNRILRAQSVELKEDWVRRIKERATGSLSSRRKTSEQPHNLAAEKRRLSEQQVSLASTLAGDSDQSTVVTAIAPLTKHPPPPPPPPTQQRQGELQADGGSRQELQRNVPKRRSL